MTIRNYLETRKGKKLSGKHTAALQHAVGALKGVLESSGENSDVEAIPPDALGGPDGTVGTEGLPDDENDGAGMRAGRVFAPAIQVRVSGDIEVRA